MTSIAYRAGVLASDSLITNNGNRVGTTKKIEEHPEGYMVCAAGCAVYGYQLRKWAREGQAWPPPLPEQENSSEAFVVCPDGSLVRLQHNGAMPFEAEYFAAGSGTDHCLGAMAIGATAEEAVRAAIVHDTSSGGEVRTLTLNPPKKKRSTGSAAKAGQTT